MYPGISFTNTGGLPGIRSRQRAPRGRGEKDRQLLETYARGHRKWRPIHHTLSQSQSTQDDEPRSAGSGTSAVRVQGWKGRETCGQDAPYQPRRAAQGTQFPIADVTSTSATTLPADLGESFYLYASCCSHAAVSATAPPPLSPRRHLQWSTFGSERRNVSRFRLRFRDGLHASPTRQ